MKCLHNILKNQNSWCIFVSNKQKFQSAFHIHRNYYFLHITSNNNIKPQEVSSGNNKNCEKINYLEMKWINGMLCLSTPMHANCCLDVAKKLPPDNKFLLRTTTSRCDILCFLFCCFKSICGMFELKCRCKSAT